MKIDKIWSSSTFLGLDVKSKLMYLYLLSHPNLSEFGVIPINIELSKVQLGFNDTEYRNSTKVLINHKLVKVMGTEEGIYFIIIGFFTKTAKSVVTKERLAKKINTLPSDVYNYIMKESKLDLTINVRKDPSPEEVEKYAIASGYNINGKDFVDYYKSMAETHGHESGFYDKNGKRVIDWKAKMRRVWFKDTNLIKEVKGAPEGYHNYHVKEGDRLIYPDYWENGIPRSKDFATDKILKRHFENKESKNSEKADRIEVQPVTRRRR